MANETKDNKPHLTTDSSERASEDQYDRGIVPAETAARKEREHDAYKQLPTDDPNDPEANSPDSIKTTDGYTVDKEGLLNNYAVEPEMYINEPGDLKEKEKQQAAERAEALKEIKEDKDKQLTMEDDNRGKGPGII